MPQMSISGMAGAPFEKTDAEQSIGLTMFGVTTPCVMTIVDHLEATHDCMVFHATGVGGRTMEKLVDDKVLSGVLDITTTEVCDLLFGGVLPATHERFDAIARTVCPMSLGRRARYDQFLGAGVGAASPCRTPSLSPQSQCYSNAHNS